MRANNILGIIFSNSYDGVLNEITNFRTMGSVPFGGRYRLIDFSLSNMVNCGIAKVGVITKSNYRSLMDHLGTGKPWDLSRKREGMFILPPFNTNLSGNYQNKISSLSGAMDFISRSNEEYVVLTDCNFVCNIDYCAIFEFHDKQSADITIAYKHGDIPSLENLMCFDIDENSQIKRVTLPPFKTKQGNFSSNIIIMKKVLLERLINDAKSLNYSSFSKDIIQRNIKNLKISGYEITNYVSVIDSLKSYYKASIELINPENWRQLFNMERPVYTKVRDDMPAVYGINSKASRSLVANGCSVEGEIENCVLFRGVRIAKGAIVRNSVIMQGSYINEGTVLDGVIMDKGVIISKGKTICGDPSYPIYISKGTVI